MAKRRRFTRAYKDQAVGLVRDSGRIIAAVAKSIGFPEMALGNWMRKANVQLCVRVRDFCVGCVLNVLGRLTSRFTMKLRVTPDSPGIRWTTVSTFDGVRCCSWFNQKVRAGLPARRSPCRECSARGRSAAKRRVRRLVVPSW